MLQNFEMIILLYLDRDTVFTEVQLLDKQQITQIYK